MIQGKYQIKPPFPFAPAAEVAGASIPNSTRGPRSLAANLPILSPISNTNLKQGRSEGASSGGSSPLINNLATPLPGTVSPLYSPLRVPAPRRGREGNGASNSVPPVRPSTSLILPPNIAPGDSYSLAPLGLPGNGIAIADNGKGSSGVTGSSGTGNSSNTGNSGSGTGNGERVPRREISPPDRLLPPTPTPLQAEVAAQEIQRALRQPLRLLPWLPTPPHRSIPLIRLIRRRTRS